MGHEQVRDSLLGDIGRRVRALRLEGGMTVRDFAERAALSPRFAHQLEAGEGNISIGGLARVAAALGCSLRHYRWYAPDKLRQSVEELFHWYEAGKLRPCITRCLPLERSIEAIRLLTERQAYGKVVVMP